MASRSEADLLGFIISNWPCFDVNPNTGAPLGIQQRCEIAHQTIWHSTECPSHIVLPLSYEL